jgi:hypothetical protein
MSLHLAAALSEEVVAALVAAAEAVASEAEVVAAVASAVAVAGNIVLTS